MIKTNKKAIIIAIVIMLIPVIVGLILWNTLPDKLPTHWDLNGNIDQYSSKAFAVFGLNGILFAIFGICLFGTVSDPKKRNISDKNFKLVIGIIPVISIFANAITYVAGLGKPLNVPFLTKILVAITFVIIGNYIPKMRQSYTLGIKLPWTLSSEDNWNRTHRFAGKVYVVSGLILLLDAFLTFLKLWMYIVVFLIIMIIPMVYSYIYYLKNRPTKE